MSKGKDFRPRRRGFDDDHMPDFDMKPGRSPRHAYGDQMAPPDVVAPVATPITATVKWFKPEKGFGFVELSDGSGDAFLHIGALQAAGYESVPPGATLRVVATRGMKGMQVGQVIDVDLSTAQQRPAPRSFDGGRPQRPAPDLSSAVEIGGHVKWFDTTKGFGFIAAEDGGKDVFVHVSVLRDAGLSELAENQPVMVKVVETPKGREAVSLSLG